MIKQIAQTIIKLLIRLIDYFYPIFKKWMSKDFYHYLACGAINTVQDWLAYFLLYHYVVQAQLIEYGGIAISPHIAALILVFPITFAVGFILSKYITFTGSTLKTKSQVSRYLLILFFNIIISYVSLKFFVEYCHFYPIFGKILATVFTTLFSYFMQKYYSFKQSSN